MTKETPVPLLAPVFFDSFPGVAPLAGVVPADQCIYFVPEAPVATVAPAPVFETEPVATVIALPLLASVVPETVIL